MPMEAKNEKRNVNNTDFSRFNGRIDSGSGQPCDGRKNNTKNLIKALMSDNIGWRVSAAQILGDNQEERAVKPLIRRLNNDISYAARISAAVALAKIGDKKALRALKKVSKHDRNQTVRTVALGAYSVLEESGAQLASEK